MSRLTISSPSYIDPKKYARELEKICWVFNLDHADLCSQAERELPEPKSWANLNADGTPKKAATSATSPARKGGDKSKSAKKKSSKKSKRK